MFRSKKHLKLDLLESPPSINDLRQALEHARRLRGCTIELPWNLEKEQMSFALAVQIEANSKEALWTLYKGEGEKSHILWNAPFNDIDLLNEVINLSLLEEISPGINSVSTDFTKTSPKPKIEKSSHLETQELPLFKQEDKDLLDQQFLQQSSISANPNYGQVNMPAPNFYPNFSPGTASFTNLPPANVQAPIPYTYYSGYPYPIPMAYPPNMAVPQSMANSIPLQPGMAVFDPNASSSHLPAPDVQLLQKKTNHMIGQFLVDAGLISEVMLRTTLKLQEMVVGNVISIDQAEEAINKFHKGSNLDIPQLIKNSPTAGNTIDAPKQIHPLIGDLLVNAQVLNRSLLDAVLKMQEIVRAGAITKEEACQAIIKELAKIAPKKQDGIKTEWEKELKTIDLLVSCSLISINDKETALAVQKKHGGKLGEILVSAGKLNAKTYLAAKEGEKMLRENRLKLEQIIIALNYCARTRINLSEAIVELGFLSDK